MDTISQIYNGEVYGADNYNNMNEMQTTHTSNANLASRRHMHHTQNVMS